MEVDPLSNTTSNTMPLAMRPAPSAAETAAALSNTLANNPTDTLGVLVVGERRFQGTKELFQWLNNLPKSEAYEIINNAHDIAFEHVNVLENALTQLYQWARESQVYEGTHNVDEFEQKWAEVVKIAKRRASQEKFMQRTRARAIEQWGKQDAEAFFVHITTKAMHDQISKMLTANLAFKDIRNAVNNAMIKRIGDKRHGSRGYKRILQGDLEKVTQMRNFKKPKAEQLRLCGLQLTQDGFCCEQGKGKSFYNSYCSILTNNSNNRP